MYLFSMQPTTFLMLDYHINRHCEQLLNITANDVCHFLAEYFASVIVNKTEAVTIIRRAQIIPYTVRNVMIKTKPNNISHVVFTGFDIGMANRTEFPQP